MRLDGERKLRPTDESYFSTSCSKGQYGSVSQSHVVKVPKFENKQLSTVAKYLGVFKGVMKQNSWEEDRWPLALCAAVLGTKLEETVDLSLSYDLIKAEILSMYAETSEQLWHILCHARQSDETFRQFCLRIGRRFEQFSKATESGGTDLTGTNVKYLALGRCSTELRLYLIEHKVSKLSLDELSDLGVAFQDGHGCPKISVGHGSNVKHERFKSGSQSQFVEEMPSSAQVLTLSAVAEVVARLEKMGIVKCQAHVCEKKLCFNCLKFRHRVFACRSQKRCDQCGKEHHSLLHQEKAAAKTSEEEVRQVRLIATTVKPHGLLRSLWQVWQR